MACPDFFARLACNNAGAYRMTMEFGGKICNSFDRSNDGAHRD